MQPNLSILRRNSLLAYLRFSIKRKSKYIREYKQLKELASILETKSISTYFQPVVELKSGKNIGYEVFNRPPVSPSFPNTENFYDFIGKTDQVLFVEEICRHLSLERFFTCLQRQPSEKRSLIFLNVHPHIFTKSYYKSDKTLKLLESYGISPENVVFELSERAAIDSYVDMNEILAEYRSQGIRIALDDIGSGYNSLKTLVHLKPEFLKLDKSLIQWIDQDKTKQQMVKLLSEFAKQTNAFLIAEGIERMEELFFLKENDIHIGQGYAIGKPSQQLTNGTLPRIYNKKPM